MAYIANSDITDVLANQFSSSFSVYHALVDNQLLDLAERLDVDTTDIDTDDDGYISSWAIKQYLVAWFCMRLFLDKMGLNNIDLAESEKYAVKYELYRKMATTMEVKITREMLMGNVETIRDRVAFSHHLFRS